MKALTCVLGLVLGICIQPLWAHPLLQDEFLELQQPKAACGFEACPTVDPGKLNVHMVPHTHDDVGWLKTVDQYFYGGRTNIQRAGVQYIIDSIVRELVKDPSKRFIYVETAFLWKWWQEQDDVVRHQVKGLINSGQLEIIGGAWSMNDEASAHYHSIIDQFTWGLRILNDTFGECARPHVGWQIDPFGHSREMASIFAQMGYDGLFFGRLDYQDKNVRLRDKTAEMVWQGSPDNLGGSSDLFTHALYNHYSPPPGFCFDILCSDEPMIDNKGSADYNIPRRVEQFIDFVKTQAKSFRTNHVILTMGEDFHYQDANVWYKNMDKIIKYVNAEQVNGTNVNVFYSTPSCYLKAVNDANQVWPTKQDDFFPYASDFQSYWTGYFTSKPTVKYFERLGNNFLQVGKQMSAIAKTSAAENLGLTALREAMGVMQHHDAITGTMKDHVASDYSRLLDTAIKECGNTVESAFNKIMPIGGSAPVPIVSCLKLNISECAVTETSDRFVVTVWNPLSRPVSEYIRLPVLGADYIVQDMDETVPSELVPIHVSVLNMPGRSSAAVDNLVFQAKLLPPLGFRSYHVTKQSIATPWANPLKPSRDSTIGNERITVTVDDNGMTTSVNMNGVEIPIQQTFSYYIGAYKGNDRASGAYIFRPNGTSTVDIPITSFQVVKGELVEEIHQVYGDGWVSQVIRVYKEENHVEFEWMVGPIPDEDAIGKEVISRFSTNLQTDSTFYTDSNGRELLKRVRDFRPTWPLNVTESISGNYYPLTSKILIRDETSGLEVAVLVDRAQAGSSISDGELELMVHRRLFHDDNFGVGEPLNEEAYGTGLVARGKHFLVAGPSGLSPTLAAQEKRLAQRKLLVPWTFLTPTALSHSEWLAKYQMQFQGVLNPGLPTNIQILTLEPWKGNQLLLRLEHILEKSDDPTLSTTVTVNLKNVFANSAVVVTSAQETTLGGNQWLDDTDRLKWKSEAGDRETQRPSKALDITAVTLEPMQIRTFILN